MGPDSQEWLAASRGEWVADGRGGHRTAEVVGGR